MKILLTGLAAGESPRWHGDRLWLSDMGANQVVAVHPDGTSETVLGVPAMPMGLGWLPDGRMLIVSCRVVPRRATATPGARRLGRAPRRPERP
jgi:sugar lactone lactonase YvrE